MSKSARTLVVVATIAAMLHSPMATAQLTLPKIPNLREGAKRVGTQALSDAMLWAAAKALHIQTPVAERAMTAEELRSAATARHLFQSADAAHERSYDPQDTARTSDQAGRVRTLLARVKQRKALTAADLRESAAALTPFLRSAAAIRADTANHVVVLPGQVRRVIFRTYCMDLGAPAPRSDERIHLVPRDRLIPPHGATLYAALMHYSATHADAHSAVQNLVWGMRHARAKTPFVRELSADQQTLLNASMSGGAQAYAQYLTTETLNGRVDEIKAEIYHRAVDALGRSIGRPLPPPSAAGLAVTDVPTALQYLEQAVVTEGMLAPDSEYTLLASGVAARAVPGTVGIHTTDFEIVNGSCEPYTLDGDALVGQSTRVTQRLALGGVVQPPLEQALTELRSAGGGAVGTFVDNVARALEAGLYPKTADVLSKGIAQALRLTLPLL
jgi:hypothetical protein